MTTHAELRKGKGYCDSTEYDFRVGARVRVGVRVRVRARVRVRVRVVIKVEYLEI